MSTKKLTKKGALQITADLDRLGNLFQTEWESLGVSQKVAMDFAYRCDLLSDDLEKRSGLNRKALSEFDPVQEPGFDPEEIGVEKSGPAEGDADEPYMSGEFTQQEHRELRETQEQGDLGPDKVKAEPQSAQPGKQGASFESLGRIEAANRVGAAASRVHVAIRAATDKGSAGVPLAAALTKLAVALKDVQAAVSGGTVDGPFANRVLTATGQVLPHLDTIVWDQAAKLIQAADLASRVAQSFQGQGPGHGYVLDAA